MANEVLVYGPIWDYSAAEFIQSFDEVEGDSITARINTDGGSVEAGWGMIAKFSEFDGAKTVKVDGKAYSMGAYFPLYADEAQCLDVSRFMFHRASYGEWYEGSTLFTDAERTNLAAVNKSLRLAFEAKIDIPKFEKISGITIDELFSLEGIKDVYLTAQQAKSIGLVQKIIKITPQKRDDIAAKMAAVNNNMAKIAANHTVKSPPVITNPVTKKNMDINQLKAEHPAVYASAVEAGRMEERDRVGALMTYVDADPELIAKTVSEGGALTATLMAELNKKLFAKIQLSGLEESKPTAVTTTPVVAIVETPGADPKVTAERATLEASIKALQTEKTTA